MIKEAYVSSEVAVLLKEKGFDEPCEMFYNEHFKSPYNSGKILKGSEDVIHTIYSKDTYEQVCEAAINYCLTHKEVIG